jgi:hypothetical protein
MRVLPLLDVTQIDILEEFQLLIVLSGKSKVELAYTRTAAETHFSPEHQVITFPLETLNENDTSEGLRRAKRIASHTTFFKAGTCLGRTLVCIVKASQFSSTIKALEPIEFEMRGKHKPTFKKLLQGGNDTLRLFRVRAGLYVRTCDTDPNRSINSRNSTSLWSQVRYTT